MARGAFVLFGGVSYLVFFATFLYLIGFVADAPFLARTIDRGGTAPPGVAVAIDLTLILAFGLQHSVMARQGFKRSWTRIVPDPIERSVYVLFASIMLILLFSLWQPIPFMIWRVADPIGTPLLWGLFLCGFLIVLLSTFLLDHFELFGLSQPWRSLRDRPAAAPTMRQPLFYRFVRHPLYSGFLIAFWATPVMSAGHLLFAAGMTAYILVAIRHEERDLVALFGADYESYRERVGMLAPRMRRG